ncbi:hypothetical protein B0H14DRAFT_3698819 [Mycena olivaceomarginata]|nr:hypothetical protein B0H14DRAFT_3698819 [Mycena olivaceomarginata]
MHWTFLAQITLRLSFRIPMYYWDVATYLDHRRNDAVICPGRQTTQFSASAFRNQGSPKSPPPTTGIFDVSCLSEAEPDRIPCLQQEICHDIFHPFSPLFLHRDADVPTVTNPWKAIFSTKWNSGYRQTYARLKIPVLDSSFIARVNVADQAIQKDFFFVTILAYTKSPELHSHSDWPAIEARLWACELFWIHSPEKRIPLLHGMEPACLQLLREALERYHAAADTWSEHAEFEDRNGCWWWSKKSFPTAYASTSDASNIDTGEMQHLCGKEGSLKLEGEAEDVNEE